MKTKSISLFIVLLVTLAAACAPAATPTSIASQPMSPIATEAPAYAPAPTAVYLPAATNAPQVNVPILGSALPRDNTFQGYGFNPYVDASEDNLSTFALDVDTASYTVARRYVMDGNLPPADAVRVEEFVNYFKQDYASPADVAFGIYADGAPSPFQNDGTVILRFGIQGYQVAESQRKSVNLTFVIDVSGSMQRENRLELVKQSLRLLVDRLHEDDTVAIVVYGTQARIAMQPTNGADRVSILEAINWLRPEGSTNAEAGLRLGYQLAYAMFNSEKVNRVILCSDGVANVGVTSPEAILEWIRGYAQAGITLTTVGFGMGNFNDVLMEQLADKGNGNYAYVDDLDEARRLFVDNLTSTLQLIALDAKVQVDFNPDVVDRYQLLGYENRAVADQDFRNDAVDGGEIGAGHSVTALYATHLKPGAEGRIATVQMRWKDPDTRQVHEINGNFNTWQIAPTFESASPRYQLAVVVAHYALVLRRSPWAAGLSIYTIRDHSVRLAGLLPEDPAVAEFVALVSRACQIEGLTE
jgi:Ca-activated chloride channel family protein